MKRKIGMLVGLFFLFSVGYLVAQIGGGVSAPGLLKKFGNDLRPADPTWELGDFTARWVKAYLTDLDVSGTATIVTLAVSGAASGTLNMNGNPIINIGNTGTDFIATTGGLTLADVLTATGVYQNGDVADAGFLRLQNAANIAWEASPAGTDITLGVDASEILQASGTFNAAALTEGANAVPNVTDNLSVFAATTSLQLLGVLSDETGTGSAVFGTSPAFTTQISVPSIVTASGALSITPAAGSNLNIALSTTGDLAVNTNQLYVDTSAGNVGIGTTGPVNKLHIQTGDIRITDTAANFPALFIEDSTNSKIGSMFMNNGDLKLDAEGGTTAGTGLTIKTSTGNVGIGTTGPYKKLHVLGGEFPFVATTQDFVSGSVGSAVTLGFGATTGNTYARIQASHTGDTVIADLVLQPSGNVGIGTTSPGSILEINPTVTATASATMFKSGIVYNGVSAMTNWYGGYIAAPTGTGTITNKYAFVTEANAGNVGIGTTGPGTLLHVNSSAVQPLIRVESTGANSYPGIDIKNDARQWRFQTDGTLASDALAIYDVTQSLYRMVIDNSGNVGIGTTGPDRLLHAEVASALTNTIQQVMRLSHITSGVPANSIGVGMEFEQETTADNNEVIATIEAVVTDVTATSEDADLVFKTMAAGAAAAERARIASTGHLSITGALIQTPSGAQAITAVGNTILANAGMIVLNPDGDYTLTSAPTIADGVAGQLLYITAGNAEANIVTVQDQDSLANSNLQLGAASRAVSGKDVLILLFDGTDWIECGFVNN